MIRTAEPVSPAPAKLRAAVGVALSGALLTAAAPVVGVVDASAPPAFTSWPLLVVVALAPVGLAGVLLVRGRAGAAAAALVVSAVFAVGRLLNDLQIAVDPVAAARPELFRPPDLDVLTPTAGAWLLLVGHVLIIAAGATAATTLGSGESDTEHPSFVLPATAGLIAGIGLFFTPFTSTDALIPVSGSLESPTLPMAGGLLMTLAAPVLAVIAASATTSETREGGLLGLAAVLLSLALPPIVTALVADRVGLAVGPFLVLAAAVLIGRPHRAATTQKDVELPGRRRLHVIAGVLGLGAGLAAAVGALTDQLVLPAGFPATTDYAARLLWPAAIATAVLGVALLAKARVRPAFTVVTATIPMAAAGALDAVFAATRVNAVQAGSGVWFSALSVLLAVAAAITAAVAGAVERDEVGTTSAEPPLPLIAATLIAGLLAVGAFGLPVVQAPDYVAIGAFGGRVGSWGVFIALAAVVAAAVMSLKSRPVHGAALLLGAAVVAGVRVLEYPLTAGRAVETAPGPGLWLALATVVALLIAGALRTSR